MKTRDYVIQASKRTVATFLYHFGLLNIYRSHVLRNKAVILAYHRIIKDSSELTDYSSYGITVTANNFEEQIKYLSKHYNIMRLSELVALIKNNSPIPHNSCVITFDDGWRDNFTTAYPILKKYNTPATIFLASNFITNNEWYWEERAKYLLAHYFDCINKDNLPSHSMSLLKQLLKKYEMDQLLSIKADELSNFLSNAIAMVRNNGTKSQPGKFMTELESLKSLPGLTEPRRFMTWNELKEINSVFEFGAHTKSHPNLQSCSEEKVQDEIQGSRSIIENNLKQHVELFAYPYGKFNGHIVTFLKNSGYSCACTLIPGFNSVTTNLFELRRMDIYNDVAPSVPYFECRLLKFFNLY